MGRRRVRNKSIPMSLSIPLRLVQRMDEEISHRTSRSKWVQHAIREKLDQDIDWSQIETKQLLIILFNRGVITMETLKVMLQSVETEE